MNDTDSLKSIREYFFYVYPTMAVLEIEKNYEVRVLSDTILVSTHTTNTTANQILQPQVEYFAESGLAFKVLDTYPHPIKTDMQVSIIGVVAKESDEL